MNDQFERIKTACENNSEIITKEHKQSFSNSYNLAQSFRYKIMAQINNLNPLLIKRQKRGLIDGLGSIIKSITGNLDQNDANRYETAISTLFSNQIKMKTLAKDQITLFEKSIKIFQSGMQNLTKNQELLSIRINEIENSLNRREMEFNEVYLFFYMEITFSQMITEFQFIYDILERIEVAITFAKLNAFHNSIIDSNELLIEIKSISEHLNNGKLPFEPKAENLLLFEKIMKIKSYTKENKIVFIIEIPIVEKENYNYYHLYPLPINKNNSFNLIIPNNRYLIINEQNHYFSENPCTEIIPEELICQNMDPTKTLENSPCEIQLLKFSKNLSNCHLIPVKINNLKIQKIEANKWIVLSSEELVATQKCENNYEKVPLKGTFLIELSPNCEIKINDTYLKNFINFKRQFRNIILPKLNFELIKSKISTNLKPIKLDQINLNEINSVKHALEAEEQKINSIEEDPINFGKINGWTIITYLIIVLIIIFILLKFYRFKLLFPKKDKEKEVESQPEPSRQETSNSGVNPRIFH